MNYPPKRKKMNIHNSTIFCQILFLGFLFTSCTDKTTESISATQNETEDKKESLIIEGIIAESKEGFVVYNKTQWALLESSQIHWRSLQGMIVKVEGEFIYLPDQDDGVSRIGQKSSGERAFLKNIHISSIRQKNETDYIDKSPDPYE